MREDINSYLDGLGRKTRAKPATKSAPRTTNESFSLPAGWRKEERTTPSGRTYSLYTHDFYPNQRSLAALQKLMRQETGR